MGLSEQDRKRIEEEELRRALRERYERELRISADNRADTSHQVEVRGLGTEIYRDIKRVLSAIRRGLGAIGRALLIVLFWLGMFILAIYGVGMTAVFAVFSAGGIGRRSDGYWWVFALVSVVCSVLFTAALRWWIGKGFYLLTNRAKSSAEVKS